MMSDGRFTPKRSYRYCHRDTKTGEWLMKPGYEGPVYAGATHLILTVLSRAEIDDVLQQGAGLFAVWPEAPTLVTKYEYATLRDTIFLRDAFAAVTK